MSDIGNKKIFAKNLSFFIDRSGKSQKELALEWNVPTSTVNNWIKAKTYPRMGKIELLANYFGIQKSDLIEEKITEEIEKDNEIMADIIVHMRLDNQFFSVVKKLHTLDPAKINSVGDMLDAFSK